MSILVPLDTSDVGRSALPQAATLAEALGESLLLVTVADVDMLHAVEDLARAEGTEPVDVLELNLRSRARSVGVPADVDLLPGDDPAYRIIDRADHPDVGMIVMATHGRTGMSRWRIGSVTERVIRGATVPVLVVPAPWRKKPEEPVTDGAAESVGVGS